jgi:DNA-binding transcriptional MocR family regulator
LQTVARSGDTIAIESPTFYGCLQAAERLGLNVVEIPTHPEKGLDTAALLRAIDKHSIRACWFMTTLQHPTGATVSVDKKRELVRLLSSRGIPLIEDDAYAELQFGPTPAVPCKAFDKNGFVLHCGSFSKCLAPGYRLGWIAAGRFTKDVARQKIESSLATSLPIQLAIAQMLKLGGYESHLVRFRSVLVHQQAAALESIHRHFPAGYRLAAPAGGYFLWIECAASVDSLVVHRLALDSGVSIAPGPMFSARRQFPNFIRLNYGHPWSPEMDRAIRRLGDILRRS